MAEYTIHKGVGRKVELLGLTAQYLFLFAGGLGGVFLLFVVLFLAGVPQGACILVALAAATMLMWSTFRLNRTYGAHGLMKRMARRRHPRRIIHRRRIKYLLAQKTIPYARNS